MKIFLIESIKSVGNAGDIIEVSDGFARNFILPQTLGREITSANESFYKQRIKHAKDSAAAVTTKSTHMAEKIKDITLVLSKKMHDDNKLYASVSAAEVVELLAQKGISVSKSQIEFEKTIKAKGSYAVTVILSSKLRPQMTLTIIADKS